MRINKEVAAPRIYIEKVICNCCGEEIRKDKFGYFDDYISIEKTWGYGSEFDGETHVIDICSHCYGEWLLKFANSPSFHKEDAELLEC
ncbi:hypothetical protein AGMMS49975_10920 [Clostridia bacterium]|nr:hypothetical protein AGMMS49975_10920 [Clostridia bacterium]